MHRGGLLHAVLDVGVGGHGALEPHVADTSKCLRPARHDARRDDNIRSPRAREGVGADPRHTIGTVNKHITRRRRGRRRSCRGIIVERLARHGRYPNLVAALARHEFHRGIGTVQQAVGHTVVLKRRGAYGAGVDQCDVEQVFVPRRGAGDIAQIVGIDGSHIVVYAGTSVEIQIIEI